MALRHVLIQGRRLTAVAAAVERFLMTNTSGVTCTVQSYPGISPYGPMKQGGSTVQANLTINVEPISSAFGDLGGAGGLDVVVADRCGGPCWSGY